MKILLDYFFPVTAITPMPAASTAFLKQACLVVKPAEDVDPGLYECTSMAQVTPLTDNVEAQQLFNAGLTKVYILVSASLALNTVLEAEGSQFYTLIISSDFNDTDVGSLNVGAWKGVIGVSSTDKVFLRAQAVIENRVAFFTTSADKAKNLAFAFGKILANQINWLNQQYIQMPFDGGVDVLGDAVSLFEDRISFVINDSSYGFRLGFFGAGGQAIVAPYIVKNLSVDVQSKGLQYVADNMPQYTVTQAALLEDEVTKVIDLYKDRAWIEDGKIDVALEDDNFVASAYINITEPSALWRVRAELRQTL